MIVSSLFQRAGAAVVPDVKIVSDSGVDGGEVQVTGDFCYILSISRIVEEKDRMVRDLSSHADIPSPSPFVLPEGASLRKIDSFVCRSFHCAKEMMLDSALLATDWVKKHDESDGEGKVLDVYLSTDGHYMARIERVELF